MRPRSITGPIILVLIGVVFLLNNLGHQMPIWSLAWDYWPVLLVALGVIGLVEVLYHVSRSGGAPPRHFGGGGILWIVMIVAFVSWAGKRGNVHIGPFTNGGVNILGSEYEYEVNATGASQGVTRLVLENVHGNVSLKGEDGGDVKVSGRKTVRAFSRNDADRANQQSAVRIDRQGDLLIVRAAEPNGSRMLSVSTDLDITVPRNLDVEARGRAGDLTIDALDGSVDVISGRGDIRVTNIGKDVKVEASRTGLVRASNVKGNLDVSSHSGGDVQIDNIQGQVILNGEYSGNLEFGSIAKSFHFTSRQSDFRIERLPGTVQMDLSDLKITNAIGPVRFKSGTRDIHATDITDSLEVDLNRGDVEVVVTKTPAPKLELHSHNGDLSVALPASATFDLEGKTRNGDTNNEFGEPFQTDHEGHSGTIRGRSGSGPQMILDTDRGTITVRKN